jgi:hypothetical protein
MNQNGKHNNQAVIVKIYGGLGNQMFQYAFGLAVSKAMNLPLKGDVAYFQKYQTTQLRKYELPDYVLNFPVTKPGEIPPWVESRFYKLLSLFSRHKIMCLKEKTKHRYDQQLLGQINFNGSLYFVGYWQSYKYFEPIRNTLLHDFTLRIPLPDAMQKLQKKIADTKSVAVHVRRGDYVSDPAVNQYLGVCSLDYYLSGINQIARLVPGAVFYVFSDDIPWCKQNLNLQFDHEYVNPGDDHPAQDLFLISQCRHFVISNSSFSWWGAWLAQNKDKIVIYPQKWLAREQDAFPMDDFIPAAWIGM